MSEWNSETLINDIQQYLASSPRSIEDGAYSESTGASYFGAFYAARAYLFHACLEIGGGGDVFRNIKADAVTGRLPRVAERVLRQLHRQPAKPAVQVEDWTADKANVQLQVAEGFAKEIAARGWV